MAERKAVCGEPVPDTDATCKRLLMAITAQR